MATKYIINAKRGIDKEKCAYKVFETYADAVSFINRNNIGENVIKAIRPSK